ncbi:hypothetical protein [Fimbriiglobus ruber]|uniref:Uncharacterized protein n=1 Tax=Fimbriiglobus ruber TaxID=1908690 RepID=A0A225E466_9BACT|nr:hypothetical protein [Fimbriiglobus ruber]OWK43475.1 hypothetical protein FRUB_03074 [Fimbriiglobus ruber]
MNLDLRTIAENIRRTADEELLDRVTVYREEMEPAAVDLIEGELARRGFRPEAIAEHERSRREQTILTENGIVRRCHFCDRPAVCRAWGWHRLWERVPLFPRFFAYCAVHAPGASQRVEKEFGPDDGP